MSVTNLNEVDKAQSLVKGLRKNNIEARQLGITTAQIDQLEKICDDLKKRDLRVDEMHNELSKAVHENKDILANMKAQMLELRKIVKAHYSQSDWIRFGVQDKR